MGCRAGSTVQVVDDTPPSYNAADIDDAHSSVAAPPGFRGLAAFLECATCIKHSVMTWLLEAFFPAYDAHAAVYGESTTKAARPRAQSADYFSLQVHVKEEEEEGEKFVARLMPVVKDEPITIKMDFDSFKKKHCQQEAKHTRGSLIECIHKLNAANIGIRFRYVPPDQAANFTVAYARRPPETPPGSRSKTVARSFPPGDGKKVIFVYDYAFSESKRYDNLTGFLCHELGHTLGMRHSRAGKKEKESPSVRFPLTSPNKPSMMWYYTDDTLDSMHLTDLDVEELKAIYALHEGDSIGDYTIKNYPPNPPS